MIWHNLLIAICLIGGCGALAVGVVLGILRLAGECSIDSLGVLDDDGDPFFCAAAAGTQIPTAQPVSEDGAYGEPGGGCRIGVAPGVAEART